MYVKLPSSDFYRHAHIRKADNARMGERTDRELSCKRLNFESYVDKKMSLICTASVF